MADEHEVIVRKATEEVVNNDDVFKVYKRPSVTQEIHIYLGEYIESQSVYFDLFNELDVAGTKDKMYFHLNNYGGDVAAGAQLIHKIKDTSATVVMCVEGPVYSMGSILALAGDVLPKVSPHVFFMFHDYSGGEYGKGNEMHHSITNFQHYFRELLSEVCTPFLTNKEVKSIIKGEDLYVPFKSDVDRHGKIIKGISERLVEMKKRGKK